MEQLGIAQIRPQGRRDRVGADDLVDQAVIADPATVRLLIAAEVGTVRLIDNCAGVVAATGGGSGGTGVIGLAELELERIG